MDREPCWDGHGSPQVNIQPKASATFFTNVTLSGFGVLTIFSLFCLDVNHLTIAGKSSHPCWKRIKNPWGFFTSSWLSFFRQQRKREKKRGFSPLQTFSTIFSPVAFIHFLTLPNACSLKKRGTTVYRGPT